jgi:hypothetical protein
MTTDAFLADQGIREVAKTEAITRVVAWQLSQEMERRGISKARLAELMHTSRAQVDRILRQRATLRSKVCNARPLLSVANCGLS